MSQSKFISRFSPNRTAPEDLERILVQRHELLAQAVALLRESALTGNKHHLLFVGPRGCGKTHLLALIAYRLGNQADLADRLRIAWLNEDETSTSFLDLLLRIYRALAGRYPGEFPAGELDALYGVEPDEAEARLTEDLVHRAGNRTVLVLAENLDALFNGLGESGQRDWRALIQNHPIFATAASAQSLFAGVSDRQQPFFGFFDTRRLSPLTVDEAAELLRKIARLNGSGELEAFLDTPHGRSRVRAIHHLAGGNPRLYIVLSDLITRETLEELTRPFERMVDEQLTPYYQERLRWLSPQQRKIVEFLCLWRQPVPVKEIAERLFATHSTIASQLKQLREMGYVISSPRGRESFYELAEPLMRLSMEIKETNTAKPLGLLVDFLRVWYEREEIEQRLARFDADAPEREYFVAALQKFQPGEPNLPHQFLREEVVEVGMALDNRGVAYGNAGRAEEAIAEFTRVMESPGAPVDRVARARLNLAETCLSADRWGAGVQQLPAILADPAIPPGGTASVSDTVLAAIFRQIGSAEVWQARVVQAVSLYAQHGSLTRLGDAMVRQLGKLAGSVLSNTGLDQWLACWESAASEHEAMRLPLRLLRAGIDFLKTQPRDEGVLLQLPKEERALARQALGLAPEDAG
ncbi:MAG: ArsR family transcriptional regulator [Limisphaerales bacterium]